MTKKKLIYIVVAILGLVAIYLPGFSKLQAIKEEKRDMERRIEDLTRTNRELKKEKEKLEKDSSYIEKIAREKLGMVRKGEIVLK